MSSDLERAVLRPDFLSLERVETRGKGANTATQRFSITFWDSDAQTTWEYIGSLADIAATFGIFPLRPRVSRDTKPLQQPELDQELLRREYEQNLPHEGGTNTWNP